MSSRVFGASTTLNRTTVPLLGERINKLNYIQTIELYSGGKKEKERNELSSQAIKRYRETWNACVCKGKGCYVATIYKLRHSFLGVKGTLWDSEDTADKTQEAPKTYKIQKTSLGIIWTVTTAKGKRLSQLQSHFQAASGISRVESVLCGGRSHNASVDFLVMQLPLRNPFSCNTNEFTRLMN